MSDTPKFKTAIDKVLARARVFFLVFTALVILSWSSTLYLGISTGELDRRVLKPVDTKLRALGTKIAKDLTKETPSRSPGSSTSTSSSQVNVQINSGSNTQTKSPEPAPPPTVVLPTRECFRYTVTHLDSSTSNLCYSKADYDLLWNLGYKLSSAKTFYNFHLDGAQRYQDEYDRTGSSIYLDAKASQEKQASRENEKIGPIVAQMQEIEKRGY